MSETNGHDPLCHRDAKGATLTDLRAKVKALPVVVVDLDPDPHGRPIERRAVLLSDVLALLPEVSE